MGVLVLDNNSVGAMLFYLAVYSAMNLGAFAIIAAAEREEKGVTFEDYRGFSSRHPWLSAAMALFLISLAGFPPTAGFTAKYGLFSIVIAKGYIWLVIIAVLNTLVSVYYYLRLVVNMYMREEEEVLRPVTGIMVVGLIVLLVAVVLLFGITPGFLLDITTTVIL
jgi:NADH-quinone oxidoreductase subunit N